jgi:hypothetical protein
MAAQFQRDWQPSEPSRDLGLPGWLTGDRNTDAVYPPLPVFSRGIFTSESGGSWHYFDSHFGPESQQNPSASNTDVTDDRQGNARAANVSNIPQSLITAQQPSVARDEDYDSDMAGILSPSNEPTSSSKLSESSHRSALKAAWGGSKIPRQSPNPGRHTSRSKQKQISSHRSQNSPSSTSKSISHQLRGVKATPKVDVTNDADADALPKFRTAHNRVEKQYRIRLNTQFTHLLEAIPPRVAAMQFDGHVNNGGRRGRASKGDVLALAKRYIQTLEQDKRRLEREGIENKTSIGRLRAALVMSGGGDFV